jgi:predicted NUDIX family phosphoesterase
MCQAHVTTPAPQPQEEHILVIKRATLFPHDSAWQGLQAVDYNQYADLIKQHKEFHPRSVMEQDPLYKQIIPYLIFTHGGRYFLMQRQAKASETRLQNKFSLGIGGHINEIDLVDDNIFSWAHREFHEEVSYAGAFDIEPLGILNDDSNPVGQVHVGFVYLLHGDSADIEIKSEHKSGAMLTLDECLEKYDTMETWSQIVIDFLKQR